MRALPFLFLVLTACASTPPYARCDGNTSCAMGACTNVAYTRSDGTEASGSFCTNACHADADCPDEGVCIGLAHDTTHTFFCVKRCTTSTDCTTGLACTALTTGDGVTLSGCLP